MLPRIVYASKVAFGECGEVTPTGESLSQMEKEIGKSFSNVDFDWPCLPGWMNEFSKKMAVFVPFHETWEVIFFALADTLQRFQPILARVLALPLVLARDAAGKRRQQFY